MKAVLVLAALVTATLVTARDVVAQDATPQPTPAHKALKSMEGVWNATLKMEGNEFPGEVTARLVCGGLWLESDYSTEFGGLKFTGKGLDGYDTNKKKFVSIWVDSMSTSPMILEGAYNAESNKLVLTGTGTNMQGQTVKLKAISIHENENHHTFELFEVKDDGSEKSMFTIDYKRKK